MKYIGRIIIVALCVAVVCGFAFLSKVMPQKTYEDGNFVSNSKLTLVNESSVELKQADKIEIDLNSEEIIVLPSDTDLVEVKEYINYNPEDNEPIILESTGTEIEIRNSIIRENWIPVIGRRKKVEIYLPKTFEKNMGIELKSGDMKVAMDLFLDEFELTLSSGEIQMQKVETTKANVECKSGHIGIDSLSGTQTVTVFSGEIDIKGGEGDASYECFSGASYITNEKGTVQAETSSGTTKLSLGEACGDFKILSGNLDVKINKVSGDLNLDSKSGSLGLEIPEESSFEYKGKMTSGNIYTYFDVEGDEDREEATVGASPKFTINADVNNGEITIEN